MTLPFLLVGALTAGSAMAAMALRNLVHCALCLVVAFAGLAALFLQLDAEFVGLVQILVYIGAVSILIVFAILLTRGTEPAPPAPITTATPWAIAIAVAVLVVMVGALQGTRALRVEAPETATAVSVPVKALGTKLMQEYVVPLEVMGLLLTAALIGAVIVALPERGAGTRADDGKGGSA